MSINHAYCKPNACITKDLTSGFTLIEMLVVMVLMGLIAALSLPRLDQWLAQSRDAAARAEIAQAVRQLIVRANLLGQSVFLSAEATATRLADGAPTLVLPSGWRLGSDQAPWAVPVLRPCDARELHFQSQSSSAWVRVAAQTCAVSVDSRPSNERNELHGSHLQSVRPR